MNGEREVGTGAPPTDRPADPGTAWRLGYRPALDGVRALAIAGVFVFHLHETTFGLGGYGVDVFFVLSGFLITLLLLQEHAGEGRIRFGKFYARRALRLLPVLYAALLVVLVHALLTKSGGARTDTFYDVGFGAVYLKNWENLFHTGAASGPLVHLWSLSLEEQFYIVWPPVLALVLARGWLRGARVAAFGGFAVLASVRLFGVSDPTTLASQRADALLLGCAVGLSVFLVRRDRPARTPGSTVAAPAWAAPGALVALVGLVAALLLPLPWQDTEVVARVGITLVAVAAAVLIVGVVLAPTGSWAVRALSVRPLVLVGRISYGLYVWHLIVFKLMPPKLVPTNPVLGDLVLITVTFVVAIASFLVIERPALRWKARLRVGAEEGPSPDLLEPAAPEAAGAGALRPDPGADRARAWLDASGAPGRPERWVVGAIAAVGALAMWWATGPRGLGVTNDGVAYLSTADNILAGRGFGSWLQMPLTSWPLGYPVLLAAIAKVTGVGVLTAARVVATLATAATAWATWGVARPAVPRPALRVGVVLAVVFAAAVSGIQDKVLSDGLFGLGTVVLVLVLLRLTERVTPVWVASAIALSWLLFLTRYAAVAVVVGAVVVLLVLPVGRPRPRRLLLAVGYGAGALALPVAYLLRNAAVSGSYLGQDRSTSTIGAGRDVSGLRAVPDVMAEWLLGRPAPAALAALGAVVLLALTTAAVVLAVRTGRGSRPTPTGPPGSTGSPGPPDARTALAVVGLVWVSFLLVLVGLRLVIGFDLDDRTLGPLYPLGLVLAAGLLARLSPRVTAVVTAAFLGWSLLVSVLGLRALAELRTRGSGYHDRVYDPTYAELRRVDLRALVPPGCDLRTNQPNLLYLAGVEAGFTPRVDAPDAPPTGTDRCVVWFDRTPPDPDVLVPVDEVGRRWQLRPVFSGDTFTVYGPAGPS